MTSSSEDDVLKSDIDEGGDLFGDDDDSPVQKTRELSDSELDSGDDENRNDRVGDVVADEVEYESGTEARILEATLWRHPIPKPLDGEVRVDYQ